MAAGAGDRPDDGEVPLPHQPVMLAEVLAHLNPSAGQVMADATVGCAGHGREILRRLLPGGQLIGVDRDVRMLHLAKRALSPFPRAGYRLFEGSFTSLAEVLDQAGLEALDGILLDAGFCSAQMDDPERGFSYRTDGPLDMRYAPGEATAADLLNRLGAGELERIFRAYGEERWAGRIARRIVRERQSAPLTRTDRLAGLIARAVPSGRRRRHPARRVFQALRIAVNQELDHLERFLDLAPRLLAEGGRLVVLTYHSLEDRLVKSALQRHARAGAMSVTTRRVVRPRPEETHANPRARSARLRAAVRLRPAGGPPQGWAPDGGSA